MKTLRIALTALILIAGLALLGGPTPAHADGPATFTFAGGSLTTTDYNAWGGVNRLEYGANFDFSAGPTTITLYGMDLTDIWYEGRWPWPPLPESQGAQARFGITANGFWSRHQIHSAIGNGGGSWDQQAATWDHDDGFRKYLIQNQWSGTTSDVTVGNHQYNVEAFIPRAGAGSSVNDPAQATDRAYRIGQQRTVQVHKFITAGTLEEHIDEMIESKQALADTIVGEGEGWLSELSTEALRDVIRLRR